MIELGDAEFRKVEVSGDNFDRGNGSISTKTLRKMEFGDRADDVIGSRPWTSKLPCRDQLVVTGGDLSKMSSNSVMLRVCELKAHGCGGTNRRMPK